MTQHTKGPWTYVDETPEITGGRYVGLRYGIWAGDNYRVAATTDGAEQAEANARLIAAAPDMLESLEIALEQGDFQPKVKEIIVNTINKAKGVI